MPQTKISPRADVGKRLSAVRALLLAPCLVLALVLALALGVALSPNPAYAQSQPAPTSKASYAQAQVAATPPMGWNSWDSWSYTINQQEFEQTVDYAHQHLQKYGWKFMVVDEGWFARYPTRSGTPRLTQGYVISPDGLYEPAPNRFPQGFAALARYVHGLGLKFGIHIVHGIPRSAVEQNLPIAGSSYTAREAANLSDVCAWNSDNYGVKDDAAGQAYYDSMLRQYAAWGVDFLKVDCISQPYNGAEIAMLHRAILHSGRPIVLSLSPGPTPLADGPKVVQYGNMWRISNDMWDVWSRPESASTFPQAVTRQFGLLADWTPYRGPGHWPDADMLPLGWLGPRPGWGQARASRLTSTEERTLITLWSIAQSPLFMGGNLLHMDPYTLSLLTNPEVIAVDQQGQASHQVERSGQSVVWSSLGRQQTNVAVFNLADQPRTITVAFSAIGLRGRHSVRDLWARKNLGRKAQIQLLVPAHGCRLLGVKTGRRLKP